MSDGTEKKSEPILFSTKTVPVISISGVSLAFLYEFGFAWQLRIKMGDLLDVADLVKTSIFTIPFATAIFLLFALSRLSDGLTNKGFDESQFEKGGLDSWWFDFFLWSFAVTGFTIFLLFGGVWLSSIWFYFFLLILILYSEGKLSEKLNLSSIKAWILRVVLILAVSAMHRGANDAESRIFTSDINTSVQSVEYETWRVLRRYSAHLLVFDGSNTLAMTDFEGHVIFSWPYERRGWKGFLCDSLPTSRIFAWSSDRCFSW